MPTVTYNNETYTCTTALKGPDYIHLLDASGEMTHAFDIVENFTTYSITDGDWQIGYRPGIRRHPCDRPKRHD